MLNSKCHTQNGYPCPYEQAEGIVLSLDRFLICLECYITYVICVVMVCLTCQHSPSCLCVHIREITPTHVTYITCVIVVLKGFHMLQVFVSHENRFYFSLFYGNFLSLKKPPHH